MLSDKKLSITLTVRFDLLPRMDLKGMVEWIRHSMRLSGGVDPESIVIELARPTVG